MIDVTSMGELLIDFVALEQAAHVGLADHFLKKAGGAPANVAAAVARLGLKAAFVGQVGDDPFGHYLSGVLEAEGIDVRGLRKTHKARTALAFVSLGEGGERSFSFYRHPSADMLMTPRDVAYDVLDITRAFHFGSITLISEPSRSATLAAAEYARNKGALISYDPNLRLALWDDEDAARVGMKLGLDYAHILKISEEELEFLTGGDDVRPLWRDSLRLIAVTHGAKGATLYTRGERAHHKGYRVQPVDTTGAGDGFVGGLLVALLEGGATADSLPNLDGLLPFANAVGALATTQYGAIPSLPNRQQVAALMKGQ